VVHDGNGGLGGQPRIEEKPLMKAWLWDGQAGLDHLHLDQTPDPAPAEGEVVLEVHYAALNPADRMMAERRYP
jgi:NADPH2:quinone reductase